MSNRFKLKLIKSHVILCLILFLSFSACEEKKIDTNNRTRYYELKFSDYINLTIDAIYERIDLNFIYDYILANEELRTTILLEYNYSSEDTILLLESTSECLKVHLLFRLSSNNFEFIETKVKKSDEVDTGKYLTEIDKNTFELILLDYQYHRK